MEQNVLKERLMNKDDKNRHFVLLIIDISKHGAKEMGHVKMGHSQNVSSDSRKWLIKHLFPPSSCKKTNK
jgi:hypothetical protein